MMLVYLWRGGTSVVNDLVKLESNFTFKKKERRERRDRENE